MSVVYYGAAMVALALAAATAGCVRARPGPPAPDREPAWTSFRWVSATVAGNVVQRAAVYVPLAADTLAGTYWLQLDTGSDAGLWLYTAPLRQLLARGGTPYDSTRRIVLNGSVGGYPLREVPVNITRRAGDTIRAGDPAPKIGTLGLEFFRDKTLLLDFPAERFAILDSDDFFYDSGASLFPVSTTPEIWRRVSGRTGREPDNVVWTVPSGGEPVTLVGAPAAARLAVGRARLERPLVFHLASGPERLDPKNWGFRASGLVGNVLFAERYLVIVDLPRRRFGLVERVVQKDRRAGSRCARPKRERPPFPRGFRNGGLLEDRPCSLPVVVTSPFTPADLTYEGRAHQIPGPAPPEVARRHPHQRVGGLPQACVCGIPGGRGRPPYGLTGGIQQFGREQ